MNRTVLFLAILAVTATCAVCFSSDAMAQAVPGGGAGVAGTPGGTPGTPGGTPGTPGGTPTTTPDQLAILAAENERRRLETLRASEERLAAEARARAAAENRAQEDAFARAEASRAAQAQANAMAGTAEAERARNAFLEAESRRLQAETVLTEARVRNEEAKARLQTASEARRLAEFEAEQAPKGDVLIKNRILPDGSQTSLSVVSAQGVRLDRLPHAVDLENAAAHKGGPAPKPEALKSEPAVVVVETPEPPAPSAQLTPWWVWLVGALLALALVAVLTVIITKKVISDPTPAPAPITKIIPNPAPAVAPAPAPAIVVPAPAPVDQAARAAAAQAQADADLSAQALANHIKPEDPVSCYNRVVAKGYADPAKKALIAGNTLSLADVQASAAMACGYVVP